MKKGFTLIELLAVIVILALVALIAIPMLTKIVERTKKGEAEQSAIGYNDAINKQMAANLIDSDDANNINEGIYDAPFASKFKVNVKGQMPITGWVEVTKKGVNRYSLVIGEYVVSFNGKETTIVKGKKSNAKPDGKKVETLNEDEEKETKKTEGKKNDITNNALIVDVKDKTYKAIVYLDPTNLTNKCNETNSVSTNETKTGCMKWYVFDDSDDNYTMILDHNTTARIRWYSSNKNVDYETSSVKTIVDELISKNGWVVKPRLITADEITKITGKTNFNSADLNSYFYFDTLTKSSAKFSSSVRSKYDWLFNNIYRCKTDYGCTIEDNKKYEYYDNPSSLANIYGYWTSTPTGKLGATTRVWVVDRPGSMGRANASDMNYGIRPVITLPKNQFK